MSWKKKLKQGLDTANDVINKGKKLGDMAGGAAQNFVQNASNFVDTAANAVKKYAPTVQGGVQNVQNGVNAAIDKGKELYGAGQAGVNGAVSGVKDYYGVETPPASPTTPTEPNQSTQGGNNAPNSNNGNPYTSQWTSQLDGLMNQILNREKFSYDMNADALYQQYKDMYTDQANMGMQNAMAQASAMTGGYGSSYGQIVGQQAYAQQMQGLNDKLPELYQNALNQYIAEGDALYDQYNLMANREAQDYSRYRDNISDARYDREWTTSEEQRALDNQRYDREWAASEEQRLHDNAYQDKLFDYNASRDESTDAQWREQFEYGKEQDALAQENWYKQFEYAQEQDRLAQENWNKQFEYGKEQDAHNNQYRQDAFDYQKEQDKQAQENWQSQFDYAKEQDNISQDNWNKQFEYGKEQDKQSQENWEKQWDASEEQRALDNQRYDDAIEQSKGTTTYEGEGGFMEDGTEVPKQLANVPGLTTTNPKFFDEYGNFKTATIANIGKNEDGTDSGYITWNIDGKEVTLQAGVNPYTSTTNPDVKNGVLQNGYQPDNIGGNKLTATNITDYINGTKQTVYQTGNQRWIWDDVSNEYIPYGEPLESNEGEPANTPADTPTQTPSSSATAPTTTDDDWDEFIANGIPPSTVIMDNVINDTTSEIMPEISSEEVYENVPELSDDSMLLQGGWKDASNSPYSEEERNRLIEEGKMAVVKINGQIRYYIR